MKRPLVVLREALQPYPLDSPALRFGTKIASLVFLGSLRLMKHALKYSEVRHSFFVKSTAETIRSPRLSYITMAYRLEPGERELPLHSTCCMLGIPRNGFVFKPENDKRFGFEGRNKPTKGFVFQAYIQQMRLLSLKTTNGLILRAETNQQKALFSKPTYSKCVCSV